MSNLAVSAATTPYAVVTSTTGSSSSTTVSSTSSATVKTVTSSTTPSSSTTANQAVTVATSSNTATLSSSTTYAYGNSASNSISRPVSSTTVYATSSSTTPSVTSSSTTPSVSSSSTTLPAGTLERNGGYITILTSSSTTPSVTSSSTTPSVTSGTLERNGGYITILSSSSTTPSVTSSSTTAQVSSSSTTPEINISENYNYYTSLIEGIDNQIRALAYDSTLKYTDSEGAKEKLAELQAMRQQIYQEVSMRNRITPGVSENIEYEAFSFTREEEKAFDLMVQENIMEFISQDKYSNDAWFDYTREEKEMCLMEVFDYVSERLGVNVDGIAFDETTSANGCYDRDSNTIIIKEGCLGEWANNGVIKTLIHEMRHAYQWAATENPDLYVVSDETRTVWAENLRIENYIKASEENKYAYRAQPVEWDAANFAMQGKNINDAKKATIIYEGSWEIE